MWGVLPVVLKLLLVTTDAYTITAVRFLFSALFVLFSVLIAKDMPKLRQGSGFIWCLLFISTIFLLANYITNVEALAYISPATVQLVLQLAPFILLLGGVFLYKETFSRIQLIGAIMLFGGLGLFFNQRIPIILSSSQESIEGVVLVVFSAVAWASYALAQKRLLVSFTSRQLTLVIYVLGGLLLIPFSQFLSLANLSEWQWVALIFCCFNTVIGYGAFTRAMHIWDTSKVSAVISIAPIFTYLSNKLAIYIAPDVYFDAEMDTLAYIGAIFVIIGAMVASMGKRTSRTPK